MKLKQIIGIIVVIAAVLLAVKVVSAPESGISSATIKIGSIGALSGVGAAIGIEERNGAILAIEDINNAGGINSAGKAKLELVSEDLSFDKMKVASQVATKLITIDKVAAIVGPQWDEPTQAVAPSIETAKVPTISGDSTIQVEGQTSYEYLFSTWYDNRSGIKKILAHMKSQGIKNIVIIRPIDAGFWKYTADLMTEYAPEYGVSIKDDIKLTDPFGTDYRTTLAKVKAINPQAVFIVVTDPTQCPFMKQVNELGLKMPVYGTEALGSYASLEACGGQLTKMFFSTPLQGDRYNEFAARYEKRFGRQPQYPSAITSYDAVRVIAAGLEKTKGANGDVLRQAIASTKNFKGVSQDITFDEKGYPITPEDSWEMQTVKNGRFVRVE